MPLYGQEISLEIHPLEADLDFGLDLTKDGHGRHPARSQALQGEGLPAPRRLARRATPVASRAPARACFHGGEARSAS